jgi:hypothetical protein
LHTLGGEVDVFRISPRIGAAPWQHRKLASKVHHGKTLSHKTLLEIFAETVRKRC